MCLLVKQKYAFTAFPPYKFYNSFDFNKRTHLYTQSLLCENG